MIMPYLSESQRRFFNANKDKLRLQGVDVDEWNQESKGKKLPKKAKPKEKKTASIAGECCPHCDARLERGDDGKCNRCGKDWPVKTASTALTRRIMRGLLPESAIARAAAAMRPGQFRQVKHLGNGQFNLVDQVVGNVGGYAGQMARKMPIRVTPNYVAEGDQLKQITDKFNRRMTHRRYGGTPNQTPVIAPIIESNERGVFQRLADGRVPMSGRHVTVNDRYPSPELANPKHDAKLRKSFIDLHQNNFGRHGQVLDSQPTPMNPQYPMLHEMWKRRLLTNGNRGRTGTLSVPETNLIRSLYGGNPQTVHASPNPFAALRRRVESSPYSDYMAPTTSAPVQLLRAVRPASANMPSELTASSPIQLLAARR
jgi:hypothetical protein